MEDSGGFLFGERRSSLFMFGGFCTGKCACFLCSLMILTASVGRTCMQIPRVLSFAHGGHVTVMLELVMHAFGTIPCVAVWKD